MFILRVHVYFVFACPLDFSKGRRVTGVWPFSSYLQAHNVCFLLSNRTLSSPVDAYEASMRRLGSTLHQSRLGCGGIREHGVGYLVGRLHSSWCMCRNCASGALCLATSRGRCGGWTSVNMRYWCGFFEDPVASSTRAYRKLLDLPYAQELRRVADLPLQEAVLAVVAPFLVPREILASRLVFTSWLRNLISTDLLSLLRF